MAGRRLPARAHRYDAAERLAEQRLPDRRRGDGAHRGQPGHRLPPAGRGHGPARAWPTDERYATHGARGQHMEELDGTIAEWSSTVKADELLELLHDGGVPRAGSSARRTCSPTRTSPRGRRSSGSPTPTWGSSPCTTSRRSSPRPPGAVRHVGPDARRAQRRHLPGPAGTRRRRDVVAALRRRHLRRNHGLPVGRRRRRHLHRHPAHRRGVRCDLPRQDPSTPEDQSVGVLRGIERVCATAGITLATSTRCSTARPSPRTRSWRARERASVWSPPSGFRQVLQIARSFVPGGLAGWIIWPKPEPLAALEDTVEVRGRIAADGSVVTELDEDDVRAKLRHLSRQGIEALSISLINAYANPRPRAPGRGDRGRGAARHPGVAVLVGAARAAGVRAHRSPRSSTPPCSPTWRATSRTWTASCATRGHPRQAVHPPQRRRPRLRGRGGRRTRSTCSCPARPAA